MKQPADIQTDPAVLVVLHRAGGEWRLVAARVDGARPSLIEARSTPSSDLTAVQAFLETHTPGRVIHVLPASQVICRTCPLPDADGEHLAQALDLQAEAHRLSTVPEYRLGRAVLDAAFGETTRTGLIISWPRSSPLRAPELDRPVDHAPEIAALAALMGPERPTDPLLSIDRGSGSVALALSHANGALLRATHESDAAGDGWLDGLNRVIIESALNVGHAPAFAEGLLDRLRPRLARLGASDAACFLSEDIIAAVARRCSGLPEDTDWFDRFGIAIGAVLAATGPLDGLCHLTAEEQIEVPSRVDRLVAALSRPRTAATVVAVSLLLLGLVPVAASGLRLAILNLRHPELTERKERVDEIKAQLAMFDALEDRSWSMTKVLADVMCATPEGIELESIRVNAAEGGFTVQGLAKEHEGLDGDAVIQRMQAQLNQSRMFEKVRPNWDAPNAFQQYEFSLSARIARPHVRPDYPTDRDFGLWTLAMRRDGDPPPDGAGPEGALASSTTTDDGGPATIDPDPAPDPPAGPESGDDADSEPSRPRAGHGGNFGGSSGAGGGSSADDVLNETADLGNIPEPLSEDQIAVMSRADVLSKLKDVAAARKTAERTGDEALEQRLGNEQRLLMQRLREAGS